MLRDSGIRNPSVGLKTYELSHDGPRYEVPLWYREMISDFLVFLLIDYFVSRKEFLEYLDTH